MLILSDLRFLGCLTTGAPKVSLKPVAFPRLGLTSLAALIGFNLVAFVHLAWLIGPTGVGPLGVPASMRFRLLCGR
jgi:hypothetical protein